MTLEPRKAISRLVTPLGLLGNRTLGALTVTALLASTALPMAAQDGVEISGFGGYTFSEGVNVDRADLGGEFIDKVDTQSGYSFGGAINFWMRSNLQIGALFSTHSSGIELKGSSDRELTDMSINNYHGTVTWLAGSSRSVARPFFMFGLGATHYSPSDVGSQSIDSEFKFSTTYSVGVKLYQGERVGFSLAARWTPTYIKSDPGGIYCSPYWGPWWGPSCVQLADPDYSNQYEFTAGIIFRP